ncbi:MAG: carboxypeptidase-like regulatory domain-containing protein [bacterium]
MSDTGSDDDAGDSSGDTGNTGGDTGNTGGDTGNTGGDTGNSSGDTGNTGGDTGNTGGDTGNTGGDTGNTGGDTGNTGGDTGNTGGDTGNTGGDTGLECTPYVDKRCNSAGNVETCNASGNGWFLTSVCSDACIDGKCIINPNCTPEERRCVNKTAQKCNVDGLAWIVTEVCKYGCEDGACTGVCDTGQKRCNLSGNAEECNSEGNWVKKETCAATTPCIDETGECAKETLNLVGETVTMGGLHYFYGNVSLSASTTISVDPNIGWLEIHAGGDIFIDATSGIYADELTCGPADGGSSNGSSYGGGGGGGHKNAGVDSKRYSGGTYTVKGGAAVESISILKHKTGSCGGSNWQGDQGGKGGGAIVLYGANIAIEGTLSAKGGNGTSSTDGGSGGGSGGSITLFGGIVKLEASADLNAEGGDGGKSNSSSYYGGAGGRGMIKILSGEKKTGIIDPSAKIEDYRATVAPPYKISSTTHPDENKWYNDGFGNILISWNRPTYLDVDAYFYKINTNTVFVPKSGDGTYVEANVVNLEMGWANGTNYFHLTTNDTDAASGTISNSFVINVNNAPPTITSSSHSNTDTFYDVSTVALNWTDPSGRAGSFPNYRYIWDRYANTTPSSTTGVLTDKRDLTVTGVPKGIWYLHVISIDSMGYPTKAANHFKVNVGEQPGKGNIAGNVKVNGTNDPIQGAIVKVNDGIWTTQTASNGSYSFGDNSVFSNIVYPWPKWEVSVEAPGYKKSVQVIDVTVGETTPLNFFLDSE